MKKPVLIIAILFIAVVFANAQPGNFDPVERAKSQTEELKQALGLTTDQATKVEAILLNYGKKTSELRQSMGPDGDREAMREKRNALREEQTKEIKAVLNSGQVEKYDAYLKEQAERRSNRGGGPGGN